MRKVLTAVFVLVILLQSVLAVGVGGDISVIITPEKFAPRVFMDPNTRVVYDDPVEPGAVPGPVMIERLNNYAFEGESIFWQVMVWDKNGVPEKLRDVFVEIHQQGQAQGYIEANCQLSSRSGLPAEETWYEGEEAIEWYAETMAWYDCWLTIETPNSMHGHYNVYAKAVDLDGLVGTAAEEEFWFFNPEIALGFDGSLNFGTVRPGGTYKSSTLTVENQAEFGSGVLLDMFLAGTDFYDATHSGTMCPTSNVLKLTNFRYYASQGAYNTCANAGVDAECYDTINYFMDGAGAPVNNNFARVIAGPSILLGAYPLGNIISPGAEMSINFKLALPEPCNGGPFTQGKLIFFGEAI